MTDAAIFLCDRSGNMAKPWAEAGVLCYCVDLQHPKGELREGNIVFVGANIHHWRPPVGVRPIFVFCFPPCTHVAVSGARWFVGKGLRLLADSILNFAACSELCEWAGCAYGIENPISVVSSHWRKPDFTFHPWEFAGYIDDIETENTNKRTCLWTGGGFEMPDKRPAPTPHRNDCWKAAPSDHRADDRAETPNGFARAVFEYNRPRESKLRAST